MSTLAEQIRDARDQVKKAKKTVRQIRVIHEGLKHRPIVAFALSLHAKRATAPPMQLGGALLQELQNQGRETIEDLFNLYDANEKLFSSDRIDELLDQADLLLADIETEASKGHPSARLERTVLLANSIAQTILMAYGAFSR